MLFRSIEMFVIGVVDESDPMNMEFMEDVLLMASDPNMEHIYLIKDFSKLPGKLDNQNCAYTLRMQYIQMHFWNKSIGGDVRLADWLWLEHNISVVCIVIFPSALESTLLNHICEREEEEALLSSRLSPGTPFVNVMETPNRTKTDMPIATGDFRNTQMEVRHCNTHMDFTFWFSFSFD